MTVISDDNRFEWDSDKNEKNKVKHGLSSVHGIVVVAASYIENLRIRIISARLVSPKEEEAYNEFCKKFNS